MQTAGDRKSQGPMTNRVNRMVGVGMAIGFIALGATSAVSCNPGALPECPNDGDNRDRIDCWGGGDGGPMTSNGGAGGGGGGAGGGGGGTAMGGSGGGGGGMAPTAATAVAGCDAFKTLGEADAWFKMRCGTGATCHKKAYDMIWQDFESPMVWQRMATRTPVTACKEAGIPLLNADPAKSVLVIKTKSSLMLKCPDGKMAGAEIMPPPTMNMNNMYPALTAAEATCIENFVKAAAAK